MAKVYRGAAFLAAAILPVSAVAQEPPRTDEERRAAAAAEGFETEDGWGIVEHELRVEPSGTQQAESATTGDLPAAAVESPDSKWPQEHLFRGWDYGTPFTFPQVYPNVGARLLNVIGDANGQTNYLSRLETELYLLHFGVSFLESVGGDRTDEVFADADIRIPIRLGDNHYLAVLPGVSFPINSDVDKSEDNTNVRLQSVYGFGFQGFGLQLRVGITEGSRTAGVLDFAERIDHTATLYGALVSWRIVEPFQVRVEASGELASVDGAPDRLSLLPGVVFFPWGDPRLHLGLTAVIESVSEDLDEDPNFGGLFDVGVFFY